MHRYCLPRELLREGLVFFVNITITQGKIYNNAEDIKIFMACKNKLNLF